HQDARARQGVSRRGRAPPGPRKQCHIAKLRRTPTQIPTTREFSSFQPHPGRTPKTPICSIGNFKTLFSFFSSTSRFGRVEVFQPLFKNGGTQSLMRITLIWKLAPREVQPICGVLVSFRRLLATLHVRTRRSASKISFVKLGD